MVIPFARMNVGAYFTTRSFLSIRFENGNHMHTSICMYSVWYSDDIFQCDFNSSLEIQDYSLHLLLFFFVYNSACTIYSYHPTKNILFPLSSSVGAPSSSTDVRSSPSRIHPLSFSTQLLQTLH